MRRSTIVFVVVLHVVLFVGGVSSNGQATASVLLDQSHVLTRYMSGASVGGSSQHKVAQTVRVGVTGQLTQLDFWAHASLAGSGDLICDIRPTETDGSPVEDDLSILAQVIIPRGDIAVIERVSSVSLIPVGPLLISLDLTPFDLSFQSGDLFAFSFSNAWTGSISSGIGILGDYATGAGPYPSGQAFRVNSNGNYFLWDSVDIQVDLGFRTFVEPSNPVPEPATIVIWSILGTLGIAYSWRRRRTA